MAIRKNIANFAQIYVNTETMKKIVYALALLLNTMVALAQTMPENGFYRVKNNGTNHYIRVEDNTGSIQITAMTADMGAVQLWNGLDQNLDKPGSIIYCEKVGGLYNLHAQGTSVYQIIGYNVNLSGDYPIYQVSASQGGVTLYLSDAGDVGFPFHNVGTGSNVPPVNRRWTVEKIDANSDNYLGVTPTLTVGSKHYAPFYAGFDVSFASSGMKAYYISKVDNAYGVAVIKEITTERIPANTPCLIECSSTDKSQNRLNVFLASGNNLGDNVLQGRYFCNEFRPNSAAAITQFSESTMRVFNVENGELVLNTDPSTLHKSWLSENFPSQYPDTGARYINANSCFLPVTQDAPSTLYIVTESEYEELTRVVPVESVELNSTIIGLEIGQTYQLSATVLPTNATNPYVLWGSSDSSVATVSADGLVTALSLGSTLITATSIDGTNISASCLITVNPTLVNSVVVTPASADLTQGETIQLNCSVLPENATNKNVVWTSSDTNVATVSTDGIVTAVNLGSATITATSADGSNISASCMVNVNPILVSEIAVTPTQAVLDEGESVQLSCTVFPENATNKNVVWTSSDTSVATVTEDGLVTAVTIGVAYITATSTDGGNVNASCIVTVNPILVTSIVVTPSEAELTENETLQLYCTVLPEEATNKGVLWSTSDESVATVSRDGLVTAVGPGQATIKATSTDGTGIDGTCVVSCTVDGIVEIKSQDGNLLFYSIDGKQRQQLQQGINIIRTASGKTVKIIQK